jgi:transcriptional regulator with GAF, ATPase, and Fis domain
MQNVIERAVILSRGGLLDVGPLLEVDQDRAEHAPIAEAAPSPEVAEVRAALDAARWVIEGDAGAAARLGLRPSTLRSRMRRLGIERTR